MTMTHQKRTPGGNRGSWHKPSGLALFEYIADLIHVAAWLAIVIWTFVGGGA